ncbi:MAG: type II secretion system protein GspL [Myxococcota bacterium]|nr:type II secretion system protein GspL [Myxococcota bacterium]MEC9390745.1 type II secretion system protein GspL [Myxococcota bacterium]
MARIIGLDIGTWSVKATILHGGFNRFDVEGQVSVPIRGAAGTLPSSEDTAAAIAELVEQLDDSERLQWGAAFPINHAALRAVTLPFTDKNQVAQTLEFEIESLVPYDLDDMIMAHRIVGVDDQGSRVLAALAPKERVGTLLADLAQVGADPKSLVLDGDVLGGLGGSGVEAILDLGHSRTVVTVAQDGQTIFSRGISQGGLHLTTALAAALGIDADAAQQRKHAARLATPTMAEWSDDEATQAESAPIDAASSDGEILRSALAPLIASIRTTLIGFEEQSGVEIDRIQITGGTSNMAGLVTRLKAEFGVAVAILRTGSMDANQPNAHALSTALADRAAGVDHGAAMELRANHFKYRGDLASARMLALASAAAALLGLIAGIGYFAYQHSAATTELATVDAQIAETVALVVSDEGTPVSFTSPDDALVVLQTRTLEATQLIDLLGPIVGDSPPIVATLNQLSASLPDHKTARIDVRELTVSDKSISLKAETDGYDAAANIEQSLSANQRFRRAKKGDEKKTRNGVQFTVSIPLGEEDAGEEG